MRHLSPFTRVLIAEILGTFVLVLAGCGAILSDSLYGHNIGHVGVSLVFGLVVMAMIYSVGNISGAHLNPAVTFGFACAGRLPWRKTLPYIFSQIAGGLSAAAALMIIFGFPTSLGETMPAGGNLQSFLLETILTFILMFVILNVSTGHMEKGIMAGVAIGGTVALAALFGGPVSGASMNPARSLGPALVSGNLSAQWIYCTAPFLGALLASPFCRLIQGSECCAVEEENQSQD